ncbi:F-box protein At5g46170-like [Rutidosis leptorrhynchoides]|uniref:F-box protein At5g46170-like n=1 Tax=Rutidosis leptorrhynchoides TaxID=125765 RepID=UPI003A98E74C
MDVQQISEQEEEIVDVFDLLPDVLVLEIFNRVKDARSLSACTVLCKRFGDLVTQTHNVSLEITRRNTLPEDNSGDKSTGFFGKFILKPIHAFIHRLVSRKSKSCSGYCDDDNNDDDTFKLPNDLLRNFNEIKSLSVKLPGHEGDISLENGSGPLLKWKAEFGKELESCVILGATGFQKLKMAGKDENENGAVSNLNLNLTNKQLKKRVVWTISCLIASSARHHMLKRIVNSHRMIRDVKISDGSKQGTIEMNERQVVELRKETVVEMERTKVPAVMIKMWYMPELELPECGGVMKGATLAVIRPTSTVVDKEDDVSLAVGAFREKSMELAVRKLVEKKKSYTLEMNAF